MHTVQQRSPPHSGIAAEPHKVGPNAVTQLAAALEARCGGPLTDAVFAAGDVFAYRLNPPAAMIPQDIAIRAHRALFKLMHPNEAEAIAFDAGLRTGDYLLAHRIPKPAQLVLKVLPKRQAADLLISAIAKNAWTFAGSGQFAARRIKDCVTIDLFDNPLATNPCAWHRGVFQRLFSRLVAPGVRVVETQCCADGAPSCRFEIRLNPAEQTT